MYAGFFISNNFAWFTRFIKWLNNSRFIVLYLIIFFAAIVWLTNKLFSLCNKKIKHFSVLIAYLFSYMVREGVVLQRNLLSAFAKNSYWTNFHIWFQYYASFFVHFLLHTSLRSYIKTTLPFYKPGWWTNILKVRDKWMLQRRRLAWHPVSCVYIDSFT